MVGDLPIRWQIPRWICLRQRPWQSRKAYGPDRSRFFNTIIQIAVFGRAWGTLAFFRSLGWLVSHCANQLGRINASGFQHFGIFVNFALMFFTGLTIGDFILLTFGNNSREFFQAFFQLFQSQLTARCAQATDIQQYFQKFVHSVHHASKGGN
ncbi:hypothetical protein WH06_25520 [Aeromonas salmonicida subsp. salmonicida]|nr:hypothetical protein WH06_25520 [Aeromonas salmonicida subsp. salmonicida]